MKHFETFQTTTLNTYSEKIVAFFLIINFIEKGTMHIN